MDPRRTLIADAAIQVIAGKGIRGLTHLAVDTQAELPKGSTSYYCRKRVDLLRLTLQRVFALDKVDLAAAAQALLTDAPHSHEHVAGIVAAVIEGWLGEQHRSRTIARFELFLATSHEPELRGVNGDHMVALVELTVAAGAATAPPTSPGQVAATLMMADGLMMAVVRQGLPTPARADIETLILSVIGTTPPPEAGAIDERPEALTPARITGRVAAGD